MAGENVEIPIVMCGGGVFVPVTLNDGKEYSFLLDNGFEESALGSSVAKILSLDRIGTRTEEAPGGAVETSSSGPLKIWIRGVNVSKNKILTLELSRFNPFFGHNVDGILGYDFFERFVIILDYENKRLTIIDPHRFEPSDREGLGLNLETRQPYVHVKVEDAAGKIIEAFVEIDTGKVDPFSVTAAFARKNGLLNDNSNFLPLKGVSLGGESNAWITRARSLHISGFAIENPIMTIVDESRERVGQIGYDILGRFALIFDYFRS